jgi:hypothetical protein
MLARRPRLPDRARAFALEKEEAESEENGVRPKAVSEDRSAKHNERRTNRAG